MSLRRSLVRHARLIGIFAGASVAARLEYRANFVVNLIGSVLGTAGSILGIAVLYSQGAPLGGWTQREALVVVGVFTLVEGIIGAFIRPNLGRIAPLVRDGALDLRLLKPIDTQFLVSVRDLNPFQLPDVAFGLALVTWAAWGLPGATVAGAAAGAALLLAGVAIVYSVLFMLSTTAFWFVKVDNASELFTGLFRAGQFPVSAFPGWIRVLFTFVVPVAFITTVPAELIVGRAQGGAILAAVAIAALLLFVSRRFWLFAIRNYTSASS